MIERKTKTKKKLALLRLTLQRLDTDEIDDICGGAGKPAADVQRRISCVAVSVSA